MFIDFKHANLRDDGGRPRIVTIASNLVFGWYRGSDGATMLFSNGGAAMPVLESPDEIKRKLYVTDTNAHHHNQDVPQARSNAMRPNDQGTVPGNIG